MTASAILNKPSTSAEHYWAARALTAESILEAKMDHQQELKSIKLYEDEKRTVSSQSFAINRPHSEQMVHWVFGREI